MASSASHASTGDRPQAKHRDHLHQRGHSRGVEGYFSLDSVARLS